MSSSEATAPMESTPEQVVQAVVPEKLEAAAKPPVPEKDATMAAEEAKLRSKFHPGAMGGHSLFLQKRLGKGQKYFDSGDYQMAKQTQSKSRKTPLLAQPTGAAIPTPESVPVRKTSIIQHNKLAPTAS